MPTPKEPKDKMILIKVSGNDLAMIKDNAARFTDGNVSDWIRFAATKGRTSENECGRTRRRFASKPGSDSGYQEVQEELTKA